MIENDLLLVRKSLLKAGRRAAEELRLLTGRHHFVFIEDRKEGGAKDLILHVKEWSAGGHADVKIFYGTWQQKKPAHTEEQNTEDDSGQKR